MSEKKVRWGILSTANISRGSFIPAFRQVASGELVAVCSRDGAKAKEFADKHEIPQIFDSYTAMLESDEIDAIYNPLPNSMHAEWTAVAAQNGKHVFCEKPLAIDAQQAADMAAVCEKAGVLLFEAFVFKCHPQSIKLRQVLAEGAIGKVVQMQAHFSFFLKKPTDNIRMNKDLAGGSLMDVGCYPITFARYVFGREPASLMAQCHIDSDAGVDTRTSIALDFGGGAQASLVSGFDAPVGPGAMIFGEDGYITVPAPYHPAEESEFVVHKGDDKETFSFATGTKAFAPAIEHFNDCILHGTQLAETAGSAAGTLNIIAAALESSRTGKRIAL